SRYSSTSAARSSPAVGKSACIMRMISARSSGVARRTARLWLIRRVPRGISAPGVQDPSPDGNERRDPAHTNEQQPSPPIDDVKRDQDQERGRKHNPDSN